MLVGIHLHAQTLLQSFVLEPFDLQLEQSAARALFPLICADEGHFRALVGAILDKQHDAELRSRLGQAFEHLVTAGGIQLHASGANQTIFTANFRELLDAVRGFILTH